MVQWTACVTCWWVVGCEGETMSQPRVRTAWRCLVKWEEVVGGGREGGVEVAQAGVVAGLVVFFYLVCGVGGWLGGLWWGENKRRKGMVLM